MAITFTYTESTNIVIQTEGTSGTPATFANFVTFDRAGTDTKLLDAGGPASDLALTYAVRPVEDLALLVKCVVANKTTEADYIFITGTDWRGAAQTESIDVSAGNASYTTTKYWSAITTLDCSDNANGGGTVWADGDLTVTQDIWGVIWDNGSGQYYVTAYLDFGNASTTSYFESKREFIVLELAPKITRYATVYMGEALNAYSQNGSYWKFPGSAHPRDFPYQGNLEMYGSILDIHTSDLYLSASAVANIKLYNSIINANGRTVYILSVGTSYYFDLYIYNVNRFCILKTPDSISQIHIESATGYALYTTQTMTIPGLNITNCSGTELLVAGGGNASVLDPLFNISTVAVSSSGGTIMQKYTCNIHTTDKDGTDLASVSVNCEYAHLVEGSDSKTYKCIANHTAVDADHKPITGSSWSTYWELYDAGGGLGGDWLTGFAYKWATTEFSTQSTDASGDITEQQIQWKKWTSIYPAEYEERRLHKFTVSLAGYETLVLENITADAPIVWHLELQPMRARNYARNRIQGVQFQ